MCSDKQPGTSTEILMVSILRLLMSALLVVGTGPSLWGQSLLLLKANTPLPEFEVATIKPPSAPYLGFYTKPGRRIIAGHCTVLCLAMEAFHAQESRISGLPAWAKSTEFGC
jgi:hypothetical protein